MDRINRAGFRVQFVRQGHSSTHCRAEVAMGLAYRRCDKRLVPSVLESQLRNTLGIREVLFTTLKY